MAMRRLHWALGLLIFGCGDSASSVGNEVYFDLSGDTANQETFFDHPFPSDLRLAQGRPDLSGYPNPSNIVMLEDLLPGAEGRRGYSTSIASYFRFTAPLAPRIETDTVAADSSSPLLIIDIGVDSPERGRLIPTVARTLADDDYVPANVIAMAPRPGFILRADRSYAALVMRSALDADGAPLEVVKDLATLSRGEVPGSPMGQQAADLYAPLWETLDMLSIDRESVAAANVFTTGDIVADLAVLTESMRAKHSVTLGAMQVDPDDGDHETFCEIIGTVDYPQFQTGTAPFPKGGIFDIGDDGLPVQQGSETAGVVIALPKGEMPAGGYPLAIYYHGSGGLYQQAIDRGRVNVVGGPTTKGEGPAFVLAAHGIATVASALPVNPERLEGATETEYLNLSNLASLPFTFSQGAMEQGMLLDALLGETIPASSLAACTGMSLPAGETAYRFAPDKVVATGQSMGGMYTNIIGATDSRIKAVVPTGAGGLWHYFILETRLLDGIKGFLSVLFRTPEEELTFLHPTMQLIGLAWEVAEPFAYMPRLGHDPLPGHPVRPVYEPAGKGDSFFPMSIYDAAALAYGNAQAGEQVWTTMQEVLKLKSLDGMRSYPVSGNLVSIDGAAYTGVVVQYEGDGISDPHGIYAQLDEVKFQYGCFLETFLARGVATVPAPMPLGTPCP